MLNLCFLVQKTIVFMSLAWDRGETSNAKNARPWHGDFKTTVEYLESNMMVSPQVQRALRSRTPVVAMESTVVAHGLPYPENLKTALACERIVRVNGGVPATVGVVRGVLKIGVSKSELRYLAQGKRVVKTGPGNIAAVMHRHQWGATSVSTTLFAAHRAGITVLVTGGIGGIHLDASQTFDVSADLAALSHFRAIVVCSGIKAPLDVAATRQYLETHGIPVIGYRTPCLPNFYTRKSPCAVDMDAASIAQIAGFARTHWDLYPAGCIVVAVPIPRKYELPQRMVERAITEAYAALQRSDIAGRDVTPFLLTRISEETHGASVCANIALLRNNALVSTRIARALCT
jgi:pseudouridine-5'-phosphate glycosidase